MGNSGVFCFAKEELVMTSWEWTVGPGQPIEEREFERRGNS